MDDSGLVVNRWKRYGKDRLYVTTADESKVGFWDLVTGEGHPESPEHQPALLTAVERWRSSQDTEGVDVPSPVTAAAPAAPERLATAPPVPESPAHADPAPAAPVLADTPVARP
jgi:hypothetical protein